MWKRNFSQYPGTDVEGNTPDAQRELDEYYAKTNGVSWLRRFLWRHGFVSLYPKGGSRNV